MICKYEKEKIRGTWMICNHEKVEILLKWIMCNYEKEGFDHDSTSLWLQHLRRWVKSLKQSALKKISPKYGLRRCLEPAMRSKRIWE